MPAAAGLPQKGVYTMSKLNEFMQILTGHFNNKEQYEAKKGENFPYA